MSDGDAKTEARRLGFPQRLMLLVCGLLWIAWAAYFLVAFVQGEDTVKLLPVLALALGTGFYGADLVFRAASPGEREQGFLARIYNAHATRVGISVKSVKPAKPGEGGGGLAGRAAVRFVLVRALLLGTALVLLARVAELEPGAWGVFNAVLMYLFACALTPLHELGHALAAVLAGLYLWKVEIGRGRLVYQTERRGLHLELRAVLPGGQTWAFPRSLERWRLRHLTSILGGPAAEGAVLLICYLLRDGQELADFSARPAPLLALAWASGLGLLWNLWPHHIQVLEGQPNDGLLAVKVLRGDDASVRASLVWYYHAEMSRLVELKRLGDARALVERGLAAYPHIAELELLRTQVLLRQGAHEAVRSSATSVLAYKDTHPTSRETAFDLLGSAELRLDRPVEARATFERGLVEFPRSARLLVDLAATLLQLGEPEAARASVAALIARADVEPELRELAAHHLANAEMRLERFEDARATLERALAASPGSARLEVDRTALLLYLREHEAARTLCVALLARDGLPAWQRSVAFQNLVLADMRRKRFDAARASIERGLAELPDDVSLAIQHSVILDRLGDRDAARAAVAAIVARQGVKSKSRATALNNLAWYDVMLGRAELLDEADRASAEALTLNPESSSFQGTRGAVLVERGDLDAGLALLDQALRGKDDDPQGQALNLCCIARGTFRKGDREAALGHLAEARRLDPSCVLLPRMSHELGAPTDLPP